MSIINQVLKDLEARKSQSKTSGDSRDGDHGNLQAPPPPPPGNGKNKKRLIVLLILAIIVVGVGYWWRLVNKKHAALTQQIEVLNIRQNNEIAKTKNTIAKLNAPSILSQIKFDQTDDQGKLIIQFDRKPHYHFTEGDDGQSLVITIVKAKISNPHKLRANTYLQTAQIFKRNDDVVIKLILTEKTHVTSVIPSKNALVFTLIKASPSQPEFDDSNTDETSTNDESDDVPVAKMSEQEKLSESYQHALNLANDGNSKQAMHELNEIIKFSPNYKDARKALVTLLIKHGQYEKALSVLQAGLSENPNYEPFISLAGHIYLLENEPASAEKMLQRISPPLKTSPDYYALLAIAEQKVGNYVYSAELYRQLLNAYPTNGTWWVGLGISLQASNQNNGALDAYKRAVATNSLPPNISAFAHSQIVALGG